MSQSDAVFDFAGFKQAFVTQDIKAWIGYYAEDAQWIEHNHKQPLDRPHHVCGREAIRSHLQMIKDSNLSLAIEDEIVGPERAAFRVWVTLSSGKRIIEHTMLYYAGGLIRKMVDVEAWD
ncbi:MAG: hypothetical protein CVV27_01965 [Candidatus Melainabacteria bacterium HGW-Melainabacteria-1]|nr:MAG: hypothetical protein CVV27_01965 [Candidatus Melainabacteria bacterium HGW-Melainabacteria-1]